MKKKMTMDDLKVWLDKRMNEESVKKTMAEKVEDKMRFGAKSRVFNEVIHLINCKEWIEQKSA